MWFAFLQPLVAEEHRLEEHAEEEHGQMEVEVDEKTLVETDEERMQVEQGQIEPNGEQVEQAEG